MTKKQTKSFVSLLLIAIIVIGGYFGGNNTGNNQNIQDNQNVTFSPTQEVLTVNYFDVGQGDCEFVELPDGKCMLIDSGESDYADKVIGEIECLGYSTIDFLVITHPHIDHMGAMGEIIEYFEIGDIYMPNASADTQAYDDLMETIVDKNEIINYVDAGDIIYQTESVNVKVLSPYSESYDELNNYSAVVKLTYDDASFLFTGDAEKLVEEEMLEACYNELDADVLKIGHHGSKYSSSSKFLRAVTPQYAVIECGKDNPYDHPHIDAMKRLSRTDAQVYRTDEHGDIKIATDGDVFKIEN